MYSLFSSCNNLGYTAVEIEPACAVSIVIAMDAVQNARPATDPLTTVNMIISSLDIEVAISGYSGNQNNLSHFFKKDMLILLLIFSLALILWYKILVMYDTINAIIAPEKPKSKKYTRINAAGNFDMFSKSPPKLAICGFQPKLI